MSNARTNLVAAFAAILIAAGTIVPVVSVPQTDTVAGVHQSELA